MVSREASRTKNLTSKVAPRLEVVEHSARVQATLYTCSLWSDYTNRTFSALRVQYNNAFRGLLGLPWRCSASGMFADSGTDGFHAVLRKRVASLWARVQGSPNTLLKVVAEKMDSPMITHWMSMHCQKPDMPDGILDKMKEEFMRSLKKTDSERDQIQKKTILQRDCSEWIELRRSLLTASNFGLVIKRKQRSKCANMVKKIIYGTNLEHVASIKHGLINEQRASRQLAQQECLNIKPCGLFIDQELPFLGASPDGVSGDTIVELKCPITANRLGLEEAVKKKKVNFWTIKKDGSWDINKNHNWYFQVQGQLHVTQKSQCLFAVWSSDNEALKTERITKDDAFWENKMKEKLVKFYMDCMLPEVVDPRLTRNIQIREPFIKEPTGGATKANDQ
ncbi:uncharacterized protein LOC133521704 [Cydia pomonella]|uniref:uncharacterized protein LOC133521704 n=1 Tax=Cydia pomonella TaxID=82600 RepID=UPI002ADE7F4B|nr:uncharacterized protein LOC133521704 [Cydia pomonella]